MYSDNNDLSSLAVKIAIGVFIALCVAAPLVLLALNDRFALFKGG